MNTLNNKFLEAYRALETELRYDNKSVLDYENSLPAQSLEQEQLKLCRIMRNYMSHKDTTFVSATAEQIKYLTTTIDTIRRASHTVKDEMKRVKAIEAKELLKNIVTLIDKNPVIPMNTPNGLLLIDKDMVIHQLAIGNKKIELPKKLPTYNYVSKDTRVQTLATGLYVVTDNGTKTGKYLGILDMR